MGMAAAAGDSDESTQPMSASAPQRAWLYTAGSSSLDCGLLQPLYAYNVRVPEPVGDVDSPAARMLRRVGDAVAARGTSAGDALRTELWARAHADPIAGASAIPPVGTYVHPARWWNWFAAVAAGASRLTTVMRCLMHEVSWVRPLTRVEDLIITTMCESTVAVEDGDTYGAFAVVCMHQHHCTCYTRPLWARTWSFYDDRAGVVQPRAQTESRFEHVVLVCYQRLPCPPVLLVSSDEPTPTADGRQSPDLLAPSRPVQR